MSEFWNQKRVLITGATGLVGAHLSKALLEKNAKVIALIRDFDFQSELMRSGLIKEVSVVQGALEDGACVERALSDYEIDTVFHLGAQTQVGCALRAPLITFEANIRGTYLLLEACRRQKDLVQRIVIASSDKAYGTSAILPYTEEMPLKGEHPYDVSKSCADLLSLSYAATYHLPIAVARCGNIYGGGDLNWNRLIPGTIKSLLKGLAPEIRSDGSYTRDYIYVADVVEGYLKLARAIDREDVIGQAFNFGPEQPYSVLDIVHLLQTLIDRTDLKPQILNSVKAEICHQSLSAEKAKKILGWKPNYNLEKGLGETIAWYENYFALPSFIGVNA